MTTTHPTKSEHVAGIASAPKKRGGELFVTMSVALGTIASILLASTDFAILGIGDGLETDPKILVLQRATVYLPVLVGLLGGTRVLHRLVGPPMVLWTGFLVWGIVASMFTADPLNELERMVWFAAFTVLIAMALERLGWRNLLLLLSATGSAYLLVGLLLDVAGQVPVRIGQEFAFDESLFGIERRRGLTYQANSFGRVAAAIAVVGLVLAELDRRRWVLVVAGGSFVVGIVGVLASQSRFSILSVAVASAILLARRRTWLRWLVVAAIAVGAIAAFAMAGSDDILAATRTGESAELTTLFGRTEVWGKAAEIAFDHPATGIGTEALASEYKAWELAGYPGWDATNAHNIVLQTAASQGFVAAMLLIVTFIVGIGMAWRSGRIGAAELLILLAVQGIAEAVLTGNPTFSVALLVAGLSVAVPAYGESPGGAA